MLDTDTDTRRPPRSARREYLTGVLRGRKGLEELGLTPVAQRRSRITIQPAPRQFQQQEYNTADDPALTLPPELRSTELARRPEARPARRGGNGGRGYDQRPAHTAAKPRRRFHPLFWFGLGVVIIWGLWQLTTSGLVWWAQHVTDPAYGATQGNAISAVLGGGDSTATPTKIIAWNNSGQVDLILVPVNNAAKAHIIIGPTLADFGVPDPTTAVIHIEAGHFTSDGHIDLKITVWADSYVMPFDRYSMSFLLTGDGKGGFQQVQTR